MVELLSLRVIGDDRGSLVALEQNKNIPFDIKRVYYIFNTVDGVRRGLHAHKNLSQALICVSGSCGILLDDGKNRKEVLLDSPSDALVISGLIWREMFNFSSDCVLMVLASEPYDEKDYIRNYEDFLEEVKSAKK